MVTVQAESPLHLSGKLKPATAEGAVEVSGREFKFSADLEFKVDVILEPKPRGRVEEPVKVTIQKKEPAAYRSENSLDWRQIAKEANEIIATITITIAGAIAAWYGRGLIMSGQTTAMTPFIHTINPNDPRYLRYAKRNPGMI
jgi:hypothetical protein